MGGEAGRLRRAGPCRVGGRGSPNPVGGVEGLLDAVAVVDVDVDVEHPMVNLRTPPPHHHPLLPFTPGPRGADAVKPGAVLS